MVRRTQRRAADPPKKEIAVHACEWVDPETGECCSGVATHGLGPPAQPTQSWWCRAHIPANYWRTK